MNIYQFIDGILSQIIKQQIKIRNNFTYSRCLEIYFSEYFYKRR